MDSFAVDQEDIRAPRAKASWGKRLKRLFVAWLVVVFGGAALLGVFLALIDAHDAAIDNIAEIYEGIASLAMLAYCIYLYRGMGFWKGFGAFTILWVISFVVSMGLERAIVAIG